MVIQQGVSSVSWRDRKAQEAVTRLQVLERDSVRVAQRERQRGAALQRREQCRARPPRQPQHARVRNPAGHMLGFPHQNVQSPYVTKDQRSTCHHLIWMQQLVCSLTAWRWATPLKQASQYHLHHTPHLAPIPLSPYRCSIFTRVGTRHCRRTNAQSLIGSSRRSSARSAEP